MNLPSTLTFLPPLPPPPLLLLLPLLLTLLLLYLQCCSQRKRASPSPAPPSSPNRARTSSFGSFQDLVERTPLKHIGTSLPKATLQAAVNTLNDRMRYRMITSKTHVGGGLSSIFAHEEELENGGRNRVPQEEDKRRMSAVFSPEEEESPGRSRRGRSSVGSELEDVFGGGDDQEEVLPPAEALKRSTTEAFRRCEVFAWLPENVVGYLTKRCVTHKLEPGMVLFEENDLKPKSSTFLVVSGEFCLIVPEYFFGGNALKRQRTKESSSSQKRGASTTTVDSFLPENPRSLGDSTFERTLGSVGAELVGVAKEYEHCEFDSENDDLSDEDDNEHAEHEIIISQGRITGTSEFIATIVGEPVRRVARGQAKTKCVLVEVTHTQLEHLFDAHAGVREEMLQRALALLHRVTYTSVFRMTGRYASSLFKEEKRSSSAASVNSLSTVGATFSQSAASSTTTTAATTRQTWSWAASKELGITEADLLVFARERRKRSMGGGFLVGKTPEPDEEEEDFTTSTATCDSSNSFPAFVYLRAGDRLENDCVAMYIVIKGRLDVRTLNFQGDEKGTLQYRANPGKAIHHLSLLTRTFRQWYPLVKRGYQFTDEDFPLNVAMATCETTLLKISERDYFDLVERYPDIVVTKAKQTVAHLSPIVKLIDAAAYFLLAQPGEVVVKEGDIVDGLMVVLHGRVKFYRGLNINSTNAREFGRGAVLGESSFLTNQPLMGTIQSMRLTSIACVPKLMVKSITALYPSSLAHIGRVISRKMVHSLEHQEQHENGRQQQQQQQQRVSPLDSSSPDATLPAVATSAHAQSNNIVNKKHRAVAVVPVSPSVPLHSFVHGLNSALNAQDFKCVVLTSSTNHRLTSFRGGADFGDAQVEEDNASGEPRSSSGTTARGSVGLGLNDYGFGSTTLDEIMILSKLQDAEEANDVVLYLLEPWALREKNSTWARLCLSQADSILFVANGTDRPAPWSMELKLRSALSSAKRELVVLHVLSETENPTFLPGFTKEWIQTLGQVTSSHHVRFHPYDQTFDTFHFKSDLRRLGRWITGNAVGLVLGGGGARGAAHMSVLKALEECRVPIDYIGGTSIGAFVGGLYSMKGGDMIAVQITFDKFTVEMSSTWSKIRDLTFPIVAYLKGNQFNRSLIRVFGDFNMEDFWTGYFCVSTDLSDSKEIVHRNGYAWKYIRASMTLTGFLPPVCDVQIENGEPVVHYLVDGGYVDNLPVDAMRKIVGPSGTIIACDVQSAWRLNGYNYGDELNGWWYLWTWLSPFHVTPKIPTDSEIQSHLAYITCVQRFGQAMSEIPVSLYLAPELGNVTTMEFSKAKVLQEQTYQAMLTKIKAWADAWQGTSMKSSTNTPIVSPKYDSGGISAASSVVSFDTADQLVRD